MRKALVFILVALAAVGLTACKNTAPTPTATDAPPTLIATTTDEPMTPEATMPATLPPTVQATERPTEKADREAENWHKHEKCDTFYQCLWNTDNALRPSGMLKFHCFFGRHQLLHHALEPLPAMRVLHRRRRHVLP